MLITFGFRVGHTLCNFIIYEAPYTSLSYYLHIVFNVLKTNQQSAAQITHFRL